MIPVRLNTHWPNTVALKALSPLAAPLAGGLGVEERPNRDGEVTGDRHHLVGVGDVELERAAAQTEAPAELDGV